MERIPGTFSEAKCARWLLAIAASYAVIWYVIRMTGITDPNGPSDYFIQRITEPGTVAVIVAWTALIPFGIWICRRERRRG